MLKHTRNHAHWRPLCGREGSNLSTYQPVVNCNISPHAVIFQGEEKQHHHLLTELHHSFSEVSLLSFRRLLSSQPKLNLEAVNVDHPWEHPTTELQHTASIADILESLLPPTNCSPTNWWTPSNHLHLCNFFYWELHSHKDVCCGELKENKSGAKQESFNRNLQSGLSCKYAERHL